MQVSVVIPCYNRERLIGRALGSCRTQSMAPTEVIVVDDGSTDGSADAAERAGATVIRTTNGGAAAARNRGIAACRGDWIAFLDSDDVWHPDKLEAQAEAVKRFPNAEIVFCDTQTRQGPLDSGPIVMPSRFDLGGCRGREVERDGDFMLFDRALLYALLDQSRVITSAVLVRRDLPGLRFPEHIWGSEDWALWLNLALTHRFAAVDRVLVTMYRGHDNLTGRQGRLHRNDLLVLDELARAAGLTPTERSELDRVRAAKQVGAVYHSLIAGEGREARHLLDGVALSALRRRLYWLVSWLPAGALRRLARLRA